MSRLSSLSANVMMQQFALGAEQSAVQPVADFIAPPVEVGTSVGSYKSYDEKNRFHIPNTLRALGGRATELRFEASDNTYNCSPHALDYPIDNLEAIESAPLENMLREGAIACAEVGGLSHEKTVIDAALAAAGAGTDVNATVATTDLVDLIDIQIANVILAAKYGSLMNVGVVMGTQAYRRLKNHPLVRSRFTIGTGTNRSNGRSGGNTGAAASINPSVDDLAGLFMGNPDVKVSFMCHDTAGPGEDASMGFLLTD